MIRGRQHSQQTVLPLDDSPETTPRDAHVPKTRAEERVALKQMQDAARNKEEGDALDVANFDLKNAEKRVFFLSACCLFMIFMISLVGQVLVHHTIQDIDTSSELVDFGGRQRMLAQKLSGLANAIQLKEELRNLEKINENKFDEVDSDTLFGSDVKLRVDLHDTVEELRAGQGRVTRDPHLTAVLRQEVKDMEGQYEEMVTSSTIFEYGSSIEAAARMYNAAGEFTPLADKLVHNIQIDHDNVLDSALQGLLLITWLLLVVVLVCVLVEGFKVFKPMMQKLSTFSSIAMEAQTTVNATKSELAGKTNIARLFDAAAAPIFALNMHQKIAQWNPKIADITGLETEDAIGRELSTFVAPAGRKVLAEALDKAANDEQMKLLEVPIEVEGKAPRVLLVSPSPWRDISGKTKEIIGLFCIAQDFTEHKAMERARETFLASFSHEIRTPLNGVLGMLQVLCEFDLPSQALTYLRQACTSGNLLLNLINDILDLSKIDAGQLEIGAQMFNVGTTVKDAVSIVRPLATKKGLSLLHHIDPAVPKCAIGDTMRLRQIMLNLLSNAIKFTMQGAVTLRVGLHDVRDGKYILSFCVEDTGVGMSQEDLSGLFKLFGKGKQTKVQNSSGCGLGLSISRKLAQLMGGDITVTSTVGKGSKFTATVVVDKWTGKSGSSEGSSGDRAPGLPEYGSSDHSTHTQSETTPSGTGTSGKVSSGVSDERQRKFDLTQSLGVGDGTVAAGMSSAKYKRALSKCSTANLLCAEDNLFNIEVLRAFVSGSKMRMTTVEDGKQALEAYTANPDKFDIILMDCQMPVMDGFEATKQIRAWERAHADKLSRPAIPIVALTAYAMSLDRQKAFDAGMDSFLTKPVSKFALIHTIADFMQGKTKTDNSNAQSSEDALFNAGVNHYDGSRGAQSKRSNADDVRKKKRKTKKHRKAARYENCDDSTDASSSRRRQERRRAARKERKSMNARLHDMHSSEMPRDAVVAAGHRDMERSWSPEKKEKRSKPQLVQQPWQYAPMVDEKAGLIQFGGSQQSHFQVLKMFARSFLPKCCQDLRRYGKSKNYPELCKTIHSLKGASGFAVVSRIFKLSVHLQRIIPSSASPVLAEGEEDTIARLLRSLQRECATFQDHFESLEAEQSKASDDDGDNADTYNALSSSEKHGVKTLDEHRLDGKRILYAEDNPFCVSVIQTYLKSCNTSVTAARDGTDVVSKLVSGRERYDCILMDCQMPVMDGFQALKVIRHWEAEHHQERGRIPIIGITAYAGHRDSCIKGGMDSFLTKPVARPVLIRTIAACLGEDKGDEVETEAAMGDTGVGTAADTLAAASGAATSGSELLQPFNGACPVDVEQGSANFGSEQQYFDLLQQFKNEFVPSAVSAIEVAREAHDTDALSKALHRLKGSAGYIGASKLFSMCAEAREIIHSDGSKWENILDTVDALLAELQLVQRFLQRNDKVRAYFDSEKNSPGTAGSSPPASHNVGGAVANGSNTDSSHTGSDDDDTVSGSDATSTTGIDVV